MALSSCAAGSAGDETDSAGAAANWMAVQAVDAARDAQRVLDGQPSPDGGRVFTIMTGNFYAWPANVTIKAGDTVKWIRVDGEHNIVSAAVSGGTVQCGKPTMDFYALQAAPAGCNAVDDLGQSCAGCPGRYAIGGYCVGPHNVTAGFAVTFRGAGTFGYMDTRNNHCRIGIKGVIQVEP